MSKPASRTGPAGPIRATRVSPAANDGETLVLAITFEVREAHGKSDKNTIVLKQTSHNGLA